MYLPASLTQQRPHTAFSTPSQFRRRPKELALSRLHQMLYTSAPSQPHQWFVTDYINASARLLTYLRPNFIIRLRSATACCKAVQDRPE